VPVIGAIVAIKIERDRPMARISEEDETNGRPGLTGSVEEQVVAIIAEMADDSGVDVDDPIGLDTRLVADLEYCSVDIIHLIVTIEEHFSCPRMGFHELVLRDNRYVDDLTVGQLSQFVARKLTAVTRAP
jgi:acyl carrier protein